MKEAVWPGGLEAPRQATEEWLVQPTSSKQSPQLRRLAPSPYARWCASWLHAGAGIEAQTPIQMATPVIQVLPLPGHVFQCLQFRLTNFAER